MYASGVNAFDWANDGNPFGNFDRNNKQSEFIKLKSAHTLPAQVTLKSKMLNEYVTGVKQKNLMANLDTLVDSKSICPPATTTVVNEQQWPFASVTTAAGQLAATGGAAQALDPLSLPFAGVLLKITAEGLKGDIQTLKQGKEKINEYKNAPDEKKAELEIKKQLGEMMVAEAKGGLVYDSAGILRFGGMTFLLVTGFAALAGATIPGAQFVGPVVSALGAAQCFSDTYKFTKAGLSAAQLSKAANAWLNEEKENTGFYPDQEPYQIERIDDTNMYKISLTENGKKELLDAVAKNIADSSKGAKIAKYGLAAQVAIIGGILIAMGVGVGLMATGIGWGIVGLFGAAFGAYLIHNKLKKDAQINDLKKLITDYQGSIDDKVEELKNTPDFVNSIKKGRDIKRMSDVVEQLKKDSGFAEKIKNYSRNQEQSFDNTIETVIKSLNFADDPNENLDLIEKNLVFAEETMKELNFSQDDLQNDVYKAEIVTMAEDRIEAEIEAAAKAKIEYDAVRNLAGLDPVCARFVLTQLLNEGNPDAEKFAKKLGLDDEIIKGLQQIKIGENKQGIKEEEEDKKQNHDGQLEDTVNDGMEILGKRFGLA
ncbi:MAG: hypothetical protein GY874_06800 [Desulfobacteraceae bacterium]|nr:hypothetical protein [Desulfobacteraceae bacterium]